METIYHDIKTESGEDGTSFTIVTKRGHITGLYINKYKRIYVHSVVTQHGLKGLMNILINKFNTKLVTFTPLITDGIPNSVKGTIKVLPYDDPRNPYKEDFKYMECVWDTDNNESIKE